jgi:hypothetical protein
MKRTILVCDRCNTEDDAMSSVNVKMPNRNLIIGDVCSRCVDEMFAGFKVQKPRGRKPKAQIEAEAAAAAGAAPEPAVTSWGG